MNYECDLLESDIRLLHNIKEDIVKNFLGSRFNIGARALMCVIEFNIPIEKFAVALGNNIFTEDVHELTNITLEHREQIDYLLKKMKMFKNKRMNPWLTRVLMGDFFWGRHELNIEVPEVEIIKQYEEDLWEAFLEVITVIQNPIDSERSLFPTYIRINTLSMSIENSLDAFAKEGWNLLPRCETYLDHLKVLRSLEGKHFMRDFHISELLVFPPGTSFYDHRGYLRGKFLIQDKGSCLSSFLLNPKPGSLVLDMCAAIGLKTNHLANIMNNEGLIYANDNNGERLEKLNKLLDLTDIKCVNVTSEKLPLFNEFYGITYILIDPSCTYSGLLPGMDKKTHYQLERISFHRSSQVAMLNYALTKFPNVKRIVYTVCSTIYEEAESVVQYVMNKHGAHYTLLNVKEMLWNQWENISEESYVCCNKSLRTVPEFDLCQGYFIAVIEKDSVIPISDDTRIAMIKEKRMLTKATITKKKKRKLRKRDIERIKEFQLKKLKSKRPEQNPD